MNNNTGSSTIESVLALNSIALACGIIGTTLFASFAHVWIRYALYESLICLAEKHPVVHCRRVALNTVQALIPSVQDGQVLLGQEGEAFFAKWQSATWHLHINLSMKDPALEYRSVR